MNRTLLISFLSLFCSITFGQSDLPVLKSNVEVIDIKDGGEMSIGEWYLDYELNPDIYTSNKLDENVTFYTDLDSISFTIHQDSIYNFVIIHGTDSAFTQVKYQPTKLDILKNANEYNFEDNSPIPQFTYQDSSNTYLKELRTGFNLDSIAGTGNEVSKILNLMNWVHDLIPHDGNHANPAVKNAMSLINACTNKERGLNCRGLAIVLNECYLSLGIKSRFVTCMPKDSVFQDCHVINMVYSNELEKWIWIDPTWEAYVMNEQGQLLGLDEVRQRLINGQPLILNPDANWNNRSSATKEEYLYEYMAKNLYRFKCPVRSEYNLETKKRGKEIEYVELIPLDGYVQTPKVNEYKNKKTGVTFINYRTNNPNLFWAKP